MGEKVMAVQANWQDPAGPLKGLAAVLGIDRGVLEACEHVDALVRHDERFPNDKVRLLSLNILQPLVRTYGAALTFNLYLGQLLVLKVDDQLSDAKLDHFRQMIGDTPILTLDLKLDKTALLALWGVEPCKNAHVQLFLFPAALTRALSAPLQQLEQDLLREADGSHKIVILVPEHDIFLDGDYLAVIGRSEIARWRDYLPRTAPNLEQVRYVHSQAESLKWTSLDLKFLTPLQLSVSEPRDKRRIPRDDALALALYEKLIELSLVYTANQTKASKSDSEGPASAPQATESDFPSPRPDLATQADTWTATYTAESYVAEIIFGRKNALKEALADLNIISYPWDLPVALAAMALWAYSGEQDRKLGRADRIYVLQGVIAHKLQGSDPLLNYREIVRQAGHLKEEVEWGWAAFVEGKLNAYFSRVRDVEQVVDSMVKGFSEQVQALTKAVTDNMLAAVGVVVGSFIAAVVKDKFNPLIFQLGLIVYASYLFFFPGLIGLMSTWQRYRDSRDAFNKRKEEFGKRLFPDEVDKIVGTTVEKREQWFKKWFAVSAMIYLVVIILLVMAALSVPGMIAASTQARIAPASLIGASTP
jgi:hypothetical protein